MSKTRQTKTRLDRWTKPSLRNWGQPEGPEAASLPEDVVLDCGWGRLIFAHTFRDNARIAEVLRQECPGQRDIALYLRDPHVVLSMAPQELFLDPSHTYRLWFDRYRPARHQPRGFHIRRMRTLRDIREMNRIFKSRGMVSIDPEFLRGVRKSRNMTFFVAAPEDESTILGAVIGVDHKEAFGDPENGSSLWCLAVDPQAELPGIGQTLVRHLAEHYQARGRSFMDLSVMHDNAEAIGLYEKLGFERVPVFCIKKKNPINEPLFIGGESDENLNPYARIIVSEARRRGIAVTVLDDGDGWFELSLGGRTIVCREALSELTTAVAFSRCDDKALTRRILARAGLRVPAQQVAGTKAQNESFLAAHGRIVVKPARGEQGQGISVDIDTPEAVAAAVRTAKKVCETVLLEEYVRGQDLRVIVIDDRVVAAAVRRPPSVTGTGQLSVRDLIEKKSRRRSAATSGESRIPLDDETERAVRAAGYGLDDVLPEGKSVTVRKTANLHTGGTIHDVTERLHRTLIDAAVTAARAIRIPVVGFDFLVPKIGGADYVIIEANERPGLANHEPQPTAERFVDLLFPQTRTET